MTALKTYTVELSRETAEYLETLVRLGHADTVSSAIEQELQPAVAGHPSIDRNGDEYRAFLEGAADTYDALRRGTMTASSLAEVRARFAAASANAPGA